MLYIVATPIGNLSDFSPRAIETLKSVNWIAAEDTRHSAALLQHFFIQTPQFSLHEHNERERIQKIISILKKGESIALISDAGTPLISDPGYVMVKEVRKQGIRVVPIPGACALIAALSASGLPTDQFLFAGFLPAKPKARQDRLRELQENPATIIFYESPHRILAALQDIKMIFGAERHAVIARELTKLFETIHEGAIEELIDWMTKDTNQQRGEFVILISGNTAPAQEKHEISAEKLLQVLLAQLPLKQASEMAAEILGERKNKLYDLALKLKSAK